MDPAPTHTRTDGVPKSAILKIRDPSKRPIFQNRLQIRRAQKSRFKMYRFGYIPRRHFFVVESRLRDFLVKFHRSPRTPRIESSLRDSRKKFTRRGRKLSKKCRLRTPGQNALHNAFTSANVHAEVQSRFAIRGQ